MTASRCVRPPTSPGTRLFRLTLVVAVIGLAGPSRATDYPTDPEEMDKFCESFDWGENTSMSAADRAWCEKHCSCSEGFRCSYWESKRFQTYATKVTLERNAADLAELARKAKAEMDAEYQKLLQDFPSHSTELRKEQATWAKGLKAKCDAFLAAAKGELNVGAQAVEAECRWLGTDDRVKALKELRLRWAQR